MKRFEFLFDKIEIKMQNDKKKTQGGGYSKDFKKCIESYQLVDFSLII